MLKYFKKYFKNPLTLVLLMAIVLDSGLTDQALTPQQYQNILGNFPFSSITFLEKCRNMRTVHRLLLNMTEPLDLCTLY